MFLDYFFYRKAIRVALPFRWKNFHQTFTKNIDLTAYVQYLKYTFLSTVALNRNRESEILSV